MRYQRGDQEPGGPHLAQGDGPWLQPGEGHLQHVSDRHPDRPAVERIGTGRVEQYRPHPEGGRVSEQGPDVLVVVQSLQHRHDRAAAADAGSVGGARHHPRGIGVARTTGDGDHTPVECETDGSRHQLPRAHEHRGALGPRRIDQVAGRGHLTLLDQEGSGLESGTEQPLDGEFPLDHHDGPFRLDAAAGRRVGEVPVLGQPGIGSVVHQDDGAGLATAPAGPRVTAGTRPDDGLGDPPRSATEPGDGPVEDGRGAHDRLGQRRVGLIVPTDLHR